MGVLFLKLLFNIFFYNKEVFIVQLNSVVIFILRENFLNIRK